mgnify:CR=1 FL=1
MTGRSGPSPFVIGPPLGGTGSRHAFVGREEELNTLRAWVEKTHDRCVYLIDGPRRMGKTSLAKVLVEELKGWDDSVGVIVNLQDGDTSGEGVLFTVYSVAEKLWEASTDRPGSVPPPPADSGRAALHAWFTRFGRSFERDARLLITLDEADRAGAELTALVRFFQHLQILSLRLLVISSGRVAHHLSGLLEPAVTATTTANAVRPGQEATVKAQRIDLRPFDRTQVRKLLEIAEDRVWTDAHVDDVWDWTGGFPVFVQACGQVLFERSVTGESPPALGAAARQLVVELADDQIEAVLSGLASLPGGRLVCCASATTPGESLADAFAIASRLRKDTVDPDSPPPDRAGQEPDAQSAWVFPRFAVIPRSPLLVDVPDQLVRWGLFRRTVNDGLRCTSPLLNQFFDLRDAIHVSKHWLDPGPLSADASNALESRESRVTARAMTSALREDPRSYATWHTVRAALAQNPNSAALRRVAARLLAKAGLEETARCVLSPLPRPEHASAQLQTRSIEDAVLHPDPSKRVHELSTLTGAGGDPYVAADEDLRSLWGAARTEATYLAGGDARGKLAIAMSEADEGKRSLLMRFMKEHLERIRQSPPWLGRLLDVPLDYEQLQRPSILVVGTSWAAAKWIETTLDQLFNTEIKTTDPFVHWHQLGGSHGEKPTDLGRFGVTLAQTPGTSLSAGAYNTVVAVSGGGRDEYRRLFKLATRAHVPWLALSDDAEWAWERAHLQGTATEAALSESHRRNALLLVHRDAPDFLYRGLRSTLQFDDGRLRLRAVRRARNAVGTAMALLFVLLILAGLGLRAQSRAIRTLAGPDVGLELLTKAFGVDPQLLTGREATIWTEELEDVFEYRPLEEPGWEGLHVTQYLLSTVTGSTRIGLKLLEFQVPTAGELGVTPLRFRSSYVSRERAGEVPETFCFRSGPGREPEPACRTTRRSPEPGSLEVGTETVCDREDWRFDLREHRAVRPPLRPRDDVTASPVGVVRAEQLACVTVYLEPVDEADTLSSFILPYPPGTARAAEPRRPGFPGSFRLLLSARRSDPAPAALRTVEVGARNARRRYPSPTLNRAALPLTRSTAPAATALLVRAEKVVRASNKPLAQSVRVVRFASLDDGSTWYEFPEGAWAACSTFDACPLTHVFWYRRP